MSKKLRSLLIGVLVFSSLPSFACQDEVVATFRTEVHSSLLTVLGLCACVFRLDVRPLARTEATDCLALILKHGEAESTRIETPQSEDGIKRHFIQQAQSLNLTEVNLGLPIDWERELRNTYPYGPTILQAGETFDIERAMGTEVAIELLLESKGKKALVSRKLEIDYHTKTARLTYRIWEGPDRVVGGMAPPYGKSCDVFLRTFNALDADDYTPLPLVEGLMETYSSFCFSDAVVRKDEERLRQSGFFRFLGLSIAKSGDARDISLKIRTKPFTIGQVSIHGYGLLTASNFSDAPLLGSKAGHVYKRSEAFRSIDSLRVFYSRGDEQLRIWEEDVTVPDGTLQVIFHILAAPRDELIVDGPSAKSEGHAG